MLSQRQNFFHIELDGKIRFKLTRRVAHPRFQLFQRDNITTLLPPRQPLRAIPSAAVKKSSGMAVLVSSWYLRHAMSTSNAPTHADRAKFDMLIYPMACCIAMRCSVSDSGQFIGMYPRLKHAVVLFKRAYIYPVRLSETKQLEIILRESKPEGCIRPESFHRSRIRS